MVQADSWIFHGFTHTAETSGVCVEFRAAGAAIAAFSP
jgi:hypothetical protein